MNSKVASKLDESDDDFRDSLAELLPERAKRLRKIGNVLDDPEIKSALLESE